MRDARFVLPVVLAWAAFVYSGVRGVDFGYQWDEGTLSAKARWSIETRGVLMPPTYDWPGGAYLVALAALAPDAMTATSLGSLSAVERHLVEAVESDAYRRRTRVLFIGLASLAVPLTGVAVVLLGGPPLAGALASALLAGSWEASYHARWAVPDPLLLMLGAAALCALAAGRAADAHRWRAAAAVFAGMAIGTKYSAWPLAAAAVALEWPHGGWRAAVRLLAIAGAAFLVTTPGAVLMPVQFALGVAFQLNHYASGHGVHTVERGLPHLLQQIEYLALVAFSTSPWLAGVIAALIVAGWYRVRRDRAALTVLVLVPAAFVLYFAAQRVMIVRNLLIILPFLAASAALGAAWALSRVRRPVLRAAAAAALLAIVVGNTAHVIAVAEEIGRGRPDLAHETRTWLQTRKTTMPIASPGVQVLTGDYEASPHSTTLVMFANEPVCGRLLPANVRGLTALVAGWQEVNLDYYPDWAGEAHVVAVDLARLERTTGCRP